MRCNKIKNEQFNEFPNFSKFTINSLLQTIFPFIIHYSLSQTWTKFKVKILKSLHRYYAHSNRNIARKQAALCHSTVPRSRDTSAITASFSLASEGTLETFAIVRGIVPCSNRSEAQSALQCIYGRLQHTRAACSRHVQQRLYH